MTLVPLLRAAASALAVTGAIVFLGPFVDAAEAAEAEAAFRARAAQARAEAVEAGAVSPASGVAAGQAARNAPRIVGGRPVDETFDDWRHIGALVGRGCGGTFVEPVLRADEEGVQAVVAWSQDIDGTPAWFVTAAHCLYDRDGSRLEANDLIVASGGLDLEGDVHEQPVLRVHEHPHYDANTLYADIAVLSLGERTRSDGGLATAALVPDLASALTFQQVNAPIVVAGWGRTAEDGPLAEVLRQVRVPFSDQARCRRMHEMIGSGIDDGQFCAGFRTGGFDACPGDSGGPATFRRTGVDGLPIGDLYLAGVVSWGVGCARYGLPGVYTDVLFHAWWLSEAIAFDATLYGQRPSPSDP